MRLNGQVPLGAITAHPNSPRVVRFQNEYKNERTVWNWVLEFGYRMTGMGRDRRVWDISTILGESHEWHILFETDHALTTAAFS